MFEKKKLWMVLATAAFVTACGGGSSGGSGGDGGGGPADPGTDPDPIVSTDTSLNGYLLMEGNNHLLFNENFQTLEAFQGGGVYGQAQGPNGAPLNAVGFRILDNVAGDEAVGSDEAIGRLAIALTEQAGSITDGTAAEEAMQIIVNGVRMTTDADNVVSASLTDSATMIVAGTTATGEAVGPIEVAIPTTALRVVPSTPFGGGDGSSALVFDLAEAFGELSTEDATALEGLAALSGRFDMDITVSAAQIRTGAGTDADVLEGEDIAVPGSSTAAPVSGSGVSGNIWIGETPPGV